MNKLTNASFFAKVSLLTVLIALVTIFAKYNQNYHLVSHLVSRLI